MGNNAKYWFKGSILLTSELKTALLSFGFVEFPLNSKDTDDRHMVVIEMGDEKYLYFLYAQESQLAWKSEFEQLCKINNIPIAKWMEG